MRVHVLFPVLALLISASLGHAQPPMGSVFATARTAAQMQRLNKSEQFGFSIIKTAYSDIPAQGGVLIGFDVQLVKVIDHETINGLRPIYLTEFGEITGNNFGAFNAKLGTKKPPEPTRRVRLIAVEGFAVSSITMRRGLSVDGIRLTFQRRKGLSLEPHGAMVSEWTGASKPGLTEKTLGGNGVPIVGVFGNMDERRVLALGIYQLPAFDAAAEERPAVVKPMPRDERPAVVEPVPREERPMPAEHQPEVEKRRPEKKPVFDARKPELEEKRPDEVPAQGVIDDGGANAEPKPAEKAHGRNETVWLSVGIFGCLSVVALIGCWLAFGGKRETAPLRSNSKKPAAAPLAKETEQPPVPAKTEISPAVAVKTACPPIPLVGPITEKPGPASHEPAAARVHDAAVEQPAITRTQPPFFFARAVYSFKVNGWYRVYLLPEMLLFLDAGPEVNDQFTRGIGTAGAAAGGILGATVGLVIGSVIDSVRADSLDARKKLLDTSDTDQLVEMSVTEGNASFRVVPADLSNARIEPTSAWHTMQHLGNQYVGLLCFHDAEQGDMTLEIPTPNDMRVALLELPAVFGDRLVVNVELDRRSWQYVRRSSLS